MRVGLDYSLVPGNPAGVGRYTRCLAEALAKAFPEHDFALYPVFDNIFQENYASVDYPRLPNVRVAFTSIPAGELRRRWADAAQRRDLLGDVDVLHTTTFCAPEAHPGRLVATIFDVTFVTHPDCHTEANRLLCLRGTFEAARNADLILTISRHAAERIGHYFDVPEDRIVVTYPGAADGLTPLPATAIREVTARYRLARPYVLSVGSVEPRKNHARLIEAFRRVLAHKDPGVDLVIAGGKGWLADRAYAMVKEYALEDRVRFLGYVPEGDLAALYSGAKVMAYPSLAEGFGLPVVEAMACGAPVLTSNCSSLPEVGGDAVSYCDPLDTDSIARTLDELLSDKRAREEMKARGMRQAARFTWDTTARETMAAYQRALESPPRHASPSSSWRR